MPSRDDAKILMGAFEGAVAALNEALEAWPSEVRLSEIGTVSHVTDGIARVTGLPGVRAQELVRFPWSLLGIAANLDPDGVDVVLLGKSNRLSAGDKVWRTEQVVGAPVGEDMIGRVVDGIGRPIDDGEPIRYSARRPIEREAPAIRNRAPVAQPLQTGLKVVDALIPIGRGQRELILGDRQTGKTAIAVDTMVNQGDKGVLCIYCAIGQRGASVAKVIAELRERDAMRHSIVVVASGEEPAGLQVAAPYTAMTIGEYFMESGSDVLIVYDDLTRHARAYRELSLLLRRPPGREAYPGDIFYIHSRLLERATHLRPELGGGSLTALPIVETQAQNLSAYIPTNLISITDGQIYLSPELFQKGILPAVDVGKSVSRVGGRAQLPAFRSVAGPLRLSYAQFEELETFARFGTRLDEETRRRLERGRRVREVLKQRQGAPMTVSEQIAVLVAATNGLFDSCALDDVEAAGEKVCIAVHRQVPELCQRIEAGDELSQADQDSIIEVARRPLAESNARPGKTDAQAQ